MKKISFTIILLFLITFASYPQQGINTMIDLGDLAVKQPIHTTNGLISGKIQLYRGVCICLRIFARAVLFKKRYPD